MTNPDDPNPNPNPNPSATPDPSLEETAPLLEEDPFPEASVSAPPASGSEDPTEEMLTVPRAEFSSTPPLAADEPPSPPRAPAAVTVTGRAPALLPAPPARPDLLDRQEPLFRDFGGYRLRLEPADLARLRELPGSRGKSDEELGQSFFDGQAERIAASVAGDVPSGAELRVVVDPYSRQAFVALENHIRGILSF
ncbi:MAG TPA: hypothetical protein VGO79_10695 [Thermoanaerobaculia bacterium]|jgi:hypothetical protein